MAESIVQVTEGVGKKLHTFSYNPGTGNTVEDEVMLQGIARHPTFVAPFGAAAASVSIATANAHVFQIMAGATNHVYIHAIEINQTVAATTAAFVTFALFRLSSAGTGGTVITQGPHDAADTVGATVMTLPTVKGTETTQIDNFGAITIQTVAASSVTMQPLYHWPRTPDLGGGQIKAIRIPAGVANGLALKVIAASAAAAVIGRVIWTEEAY